MVEKKETIFGQKVKHSRLSEAISITSPSAFKKSIRIVMKMRGIPALDRKKALVLARTRGTAQLMRKDLSRKERKQFEAISRISIPGIEKF